MSKVHKMSTMRWNADGLKQSDIDDAVIHFACAYDGSDVSTNALNLCIEYFLPKRKNAAVTTLYVDDPAKTYLPPKQRRAAVEQFVNTQKFMFKGRLDTRIIPKDHDKLVGRHLCEFANDSGCDFLVIGMYGRKGVKDHTDTIIASNANYALQYARCSTILIQEPFLPYSQVHFLVAMDRGKSSEKAMVDALLLSEPDDKITLLHIVMRDEQDAANDEKADPLKGYREKLEPLVAQWTTQVNRPRNVDIVFVDESSQPPSHDIIDYASNNNVHVMCVGADVRRLRANQNYMGSTSAVVLANCVRQGVPCVVAHFDEQFSEVGADGSTAAPGPEALPATAQFATPGPATAWDHKYRGTFSIGQT